MRPVASRAVATISRSPVARAGPFSDERGRGVRVTGIEVAVAARIPARGFVKLGVGRLTAPDLVSHLRLWQRRAEVVARLEGERRAFPGQIALPGRRDRHLELW